MRSLSCSAASGQHLAAQQTLTLTLSRRTGRGDQRPLAAFAVLVPLVVLLLANVAAAQTAAPLFAAKVYRPGRYILIQLDAAGPGDIHVRGVGVQGVDWPAPGRGTAVVPLLIYDARPGGITLTVNGQPQRLGLQPLGPDDADPPGLLAAWRALDPKPPAGPAFDEDAYEAAALWTPGRAWAVRQWTLVAALVVVLVLLVARYADPHRPTTWVVLASLGLCVGGVALFPPDAPRRVLPAEGQPGWKWVWQAAFEPRSAVEEWIAGARFVPRSPAQLQAADPVLECNAAGEPVQFRVNVGRGGRAVFAQP